MKLHILFGAALAMVCGGLAASDSSSSSYHPSSPYGTWRPLNNQPNFVSYDLTDPFDPVPDAGGAFEPRLLTDGSVVMQNVGVWSTPEMWRLVPDEFGSYVNGTWSQIASLPLNYNVTTGAVLADGRFLIAGAEYIDWDYKFLLPNQSFIYDPVEGSWTSFSGPFFFTDLYGPRASYAPSPVGDAANIVLSDGTFMLQNKMSTQAALLDLKTLTWKETGTTSKAPRWNDEEGLTLLPNGKVLTVNCYTESHFIPSMYPYPEDPTGSQIYDPKTGLWTSAGSTINSLTDPEGAEIGAAILRPDGTVFQIGASGYTSIYDYRKNRWSVGPTLPVGTGDEGQLGQQDGPAALLPNGNVLFPASPISPVFAPGLHFYVFDGTSLYEQPNIPNATEINPSIGTPDAAWMISLLVLPTGEVLSVDGSNDVEIYTPDDRSYDPNWAPVISECPKKVERNKTYKIKGIRFNGMSQASAFGDESQNATNYPLVRITNNSTGHVFYCRTHDHSYMGVASDKKVHTYFDVPANIEKGKSKLEVVANGIPSKPMHIVVH
ncbi:MAG: hypothetical protein JSR37_03010 [Verrucomicrobia bacterium]|nr:hypothetical protein [Verrucomicrobiota bacterium]MBS0636599.1 hypothetical protein [Verrucomicrobiota bacterium]